MPRTCPAAPSLHSKKATLIPWKFLEYAAEHLGLEEVIETVGQLSVAIRIAERRTPNSSAW